MRGGFLILDFGSQYTQLIARRLREFGVYSEILPFDVPLRLLKEKAPRGIVLSGGPSSVSEPGAPQRSVQELSQLAPVLGICYGMQLMAKEFGGQVEPAHRREYGLSEVDWLELMVKDVPRRHNVWMSHGDVVSRVPESFKVMARSGFSHPAAIMGSRLWGLQFHPEVSHTEFGVNLLKSFVFDLCQGEANWRADDIVDHILQDIRERIPQGEQVLCALSGGVDSTVVGVLLTRALGPERVHCVFVDTGLLRQDEFQEVQGIYRDLGLNLHSVRAEDDFLSALQDVEDPERKRKIIGHKFIDVFRSEIKKLGQVQWLAQGTLYPDVIESVSPRGTSVTIKTHHNVGGLPKDLDLKLIEPLRELFKDEVRNLGRKLQIPERILQRHPFPGPGLAIRILGPVNRDDLRLLKAADAIFTSELRRAGLYEKIWQAFCVLLPVKSVGVQGDGRTYERVVALRAVTSVDGMTADWFDFPVDFLRHVSNRITNEVRGVNRVVLDVTSKPPGTIEWE